jgi:hypothetical protein
VNLFVIAPDFFAILPQFVLFGGCDLTLGGQQGARDHE